MLVNARIGLRAVNRHGPFTQRDAAIGGVAERRGIVIRYKRQMVEIARKERADRNDNRLPVSDIGIFIGRERRGVCYARSLRAVNPETVIVVAEVLVVVEPDGGHLVDKCRTELEFQIGVRRDGVIERQSFPWASVGKRNLVITGHGHDAADILPRNVWRELPRIIERHIGFVEGRPLARPDLPVQEFFLDIQQIGFRQIKELEVRLDSAVGLVDGEDVLADSIEQSGQIPRPVP